MINNRLFLRASFLLAVVVGLSSCATLRLTGEGERIRVLNPAEVNSCRELGQTRASVTPLIFGIDRPIETISKELQMVARNSAVKLEGDTIVALTVIDEGKQTFVVYKCVDPNS
ncbi:MAG: hypothetical protein ACI822_001444 [Gammaproteobacteria bacterium]|jgi:hypothetical protein